MENSDRRAKTVILLFFIMISMSALAYSLSESIFSNYYKEAYNVTAQQRGFIEFPRELPGVLATVVIALLSALGDLRTAVLAHFLGGFGLMVLGLYTPVFSVMLIFLFINSLGMHLFMPLQDSIGMSLAEKDKVGARMGQYFSVRSAMQFVGGIIAFVGFRFGFFSFKTQIKIPFLIGAAAYVVAFITALMIVKILNPPKGEKKKFQLIIKKEFRYYYGLAVLHGVQKQIAFVYGSWVVVDLLKKGADVMSLLVIASSFIGIFFLDRIGKWLDHFGVIKMLTAEALTLMIVYTVYGFVVWGIASGVLGNGVFPVVTVYLLFVLDRMSQQMHIVKSVYLKSISKDPKETTATLSMGLSLDHIVAIIMGVVGGIIWDELGSQWIFFIAAALSVGNLIITSRIKKHQPLAAKTAE